MDGLEISEVIYRLAVSSHGAHRWDSDYYKKIFTENTKKLSKLKTKPFHKLCRFVKKGIFDLPPSNYKESGIPLIRTTEIKNPTIDFRTTVYIDEKTNNSQEKTHLFPNDMVFTKIGAYIGDVAILPSNHNVYNFSQNVAGASLKNKEYGPYYLSFFLSSLGKNQILRSIMLSGQGKLELDDIRNYQVPDVSSNFAKLIAALFRAKEKEVNSSRNEYKNAENKLLRAIGLNSVKFNPASLNIVQFVDSYSLSGRLDAEYYQPKYEELVSHIKDGTYDTLDNISEINKSIEPGSSAYSDEGLPFIRVADYDQYNLIENTAKKLSHEYCSKNDKLLEKLKPKKGTILFSKDGSVGIAHLIKKDMDIITSGAILHIIIKDNKKILPEYLTLVLNSFVVKMQAERDVGGSIILHWRVGEINNVVIPIVDINIQNDIANKINDSFKMRNRSEFLLEIAKYAVEIAIEQDEETAEKFIFEECKKIGINLEGEGNA